MAGLVIRALPKRLFDFGNAALGSIPQVIVKERIDISQYIDCMVALRVHAATLAAGNSISFDVFGDGLTTEDPGLIFRTSNALFPSSPITSSGTALLTYGGTVRGQYATLLVSGTKSVAGSITATVSIDLVLRNPDNS